MKYVVLLNPLSGHNAAEEAKVRLEKILAGNELIFEDVTKTDVANLIKQADGDTAIVIVGGDGTLNRFINTVDCDNLKNKLYIYPAGSGNDFCNDIADTAEAFTCDGDEAEESGKLYPINDFVTNLPVVTVNGKEYKFINGIGYGIDGYCCEVGDKLKAAGKKVNYTSIAIKGLLFHFKPRNATIIVDGTTYHFNKVWIAPAMIGRFYGGGMMPTPAQNRHSEKLSMCILHGTGRLGTLMVFPKVFTGKHVEKEKIIKILEGNEITVQFDKPCALQVDGETILNVSSYTAKRNG